MRLILFLFFELLLFVSIILAKASHILPAKELKRRARSGKDKKASKIYKMVSYKTSLELLLWLIGSISAAVVLVMATHASGWLTFGLTIFTAYLLFGWHPHDARGWAWYLSALLAPLLAALAARLHPILGRLRTADVGRLHKHTGIFEKEDLLELLNKQNVQGDNRITEGELKMAFGALTFADKTAGSLMTPLSKIRLLFADEVAGPLLMDELHATGFSRFPVAKARTAKSASPQIVGALYTKDLLDYSGSGKVRDLMQKGAYFVNESQNLRQVLAVFLKTNHPLLMVVNSFSEIVGFLTIEAVLEQIVGGKIDDDFDQYDDLQAVAAAPSQKGRSEPEAVQPSKPAEETVIQ